MGKGEEDEGGKGKSSEVIRRREEGGRRGVMLKVAFLAGLGREEEAGIEIEGTGEII